ncbi:hypothetical protein PYCC9005_001720 [Savitreella phatthalungensis]
MQNILLLASVTMAAPVAQLQQLVGLLGGALPGGLPGGLSGAQQGGAAPANPLGQLTGLAPGLNELAAKLPVDLSFLMGGGSPAGAPPAQAASSKTSQQRQAATQPAQTSSQTSTPAETAGILRRRAYSPDPDSDVDDPRDD